MGEKVTDAELVKAAAEKVMGFEFERAGSPAPQAPVYASFHENGAIILHFAIVGDRAEWNPLTSDADAWMLIDRLEKLGFSYAITGTPLHSSFRGWVAFKRGVRPPTCDDTGVSPVLKGPEGRRRAIVLAAINALAIPANPQ